MQVEKSSQRCNCLRDDQSMLGPHHAPYCHFRASVPAYRADFNGGMVMQLKMTGSPARVHDSEILQELLDERQRQDDKYGAGRAMPLLEWWAILSEEYGEAAHDLVDGHWCSEQSADGTLFRSEQQGVYRDNLRKELIQTAAVAVAMVDSLDRGAVI